MKRLICETCKGIRQVGVDERSEQRVLCSRRLFSVTKTGKVDGKGDVGTYIDVAFYVPDEDEVATTGVADVGVNGDGTPRVSLNGIRQLRGVTSDEAVSECSGAVDETGGGRGWPKHFLCGTKIKEMRGR